MAPAGLFAGLKFFVCKVGDADLPRRAELVQLLKAGGGEVLSRLEALKLQPAEVMRLVLDPFEVPDKETGIVRRLLSRLSPASEPDAEACAGLRTFSTRSGRLTA